MSNLDVSGLAHFIVNDNGFNELQAKAFRDICRQTNDDAGACRGVRLFLEFLEKESGEFNPTEEPLKRKSGTKKSVEEIPDLSIPSIGSASSDPDLNPPAE